MSGPQFVHDCTKCRFLGGYTFMNAHYDLYCCVDLARPESTSLLARTSDVDSDYASSIVGVLLTHGDAEVRKTPMGEAWRRAIQQGYALSSEALKRNSASLLLSEDMMHACKLVEAAQTVTSTFIMNAKQIQIARRHIECFLIRGEDYEKEYWSAVVKYLTAAEADAVDAEKKKSTK